MGAVFVRLGCSDEAVTSFDRGLALRSGTVRCRLDPGRHGDVVIGSRYVASGSIDGRWGVGIRLLSRNRLVRWISGIQGLHDCTAGFKAIEADVLRAVRFVKIDTRGHVFQMVLRFWEPSGQQRPTGAVAVTRGRSNRANRANV